MSSKPSRRELIAKGATAAAAISVPCLAMSQAPAATPPPPPTASIEEAERPLAKPLSAEIRKLLKPALEANAGNARQRLDHKLKENSEPCFSYRAEPKQVRSR